MQISVSVRCYQVIVKFLHMISMSQEDKRLRYDNYRYVHYNAQHIPPHFHAPGMS